MYSICPTAPLSSSQQNSFTRLCLKDCYIFTRDRTFKFINNPLSLINCSNYQRLCEVFAAFTLAERFKLRKNYLYLYLILWSLNLAKLLLQIPKSPDSSSWLPRELLKDSTTKVWCLFLSFQKNAWRWPANLNPLAILLVGNNSNPYSYCPVTCAHAGACVYKRCRES